MKLTDFDFDYSVLSGFRERLADGESQTLLLDRMLELLREKKLLKTRGKQRTDSGARFSFNPRDESIGDGIETMRAALNQPVTITPEWLTQVSKPEWFALHSFRAKQSRLPHGNKARETIASQVAEDGFLLFKMLIEQQPDLLELEKVETLRKI